MSAAALVCVCGLAAGGELGSTRIVALQGERASALSGDAGFFSFDMATARINGRGEVAFAARLDSLFFDGIFAERGGVLEAVALETPRPDGVGPVFVDVIGGFDFNSAGQVVYSSLVVDDPTRAGVPQIALSTPGEAARVVWDDAQLDPSGTFTMNDARAAVMLEDGRAVFRAELVSGFDNDNGGIFTYSPDRGLEPLVIGGTTLPGTSLNAASVRAFEVNGGGDVLYAAVTGGAGRRGYFLTRGDRSTDILVRENRQAPGEADGVVVRELFDERAASGNMLSLNDLGRFVYAAEVWDGAEERRAIYTGTNSGDIRRVAGQGDAAPQGGTFEAVFTSSMRLAGNGDIAFFSIVQTPDSGKTALMLERGGTLGVVAQGGGVFELEGRERVVESVRRDASMEVNAVGTIVFSAVLEERSLQSTRSPHALIAVTVDGETILVAEQGELFSDPGTHAFGRVEGFGSAYDPNDRNELVLELSFEDGTRGVFVTTVPTPSGLALIGGCWARGGAPSAVA